MERRRRFSSDAPLSVRSYPDRRRDGSRMLQHLFQHLIFAAKRLRSALTHDQHVVDTGQCARPVCNHDQNSAAGAYIQNGLRQRLLALSIEIGTWLVEHDQERTSVE